VRYKTALPLGFCWQIIYKLQKKLAYSKSYHMFINFDAVQYVELICRI
jgi:hypothetical protein